MISHLLDDHWLAALAQYDTLYVGYSGGLDSTVLLHLLSQQPQLKPKISAVHVHHGLSPDADAWQVHCALFCRAQGIAFSAARVTIPGDTNLEAHAREARYRIFSSRLTPQDALVLAHHCDDQAETLLLHLFRGCGVDGLAAMRAITPFSGATIVRPLLDKRREVLQAYAQSHVLAWVDDESNQDIGFSRNYLRHVVLPLIEKQWPGVVTTLVRSAAHCQQAKQNLEALAQLDCPDLCHHTGTLPLASLSAFSRARLVNVLRLWLQQCEQPCPTTALLSRIIDEVILAREDAHPSVEWGEVAVKRYQDQLYLVFKNQIALAPMPQVWSNFPEACSITGFGYVHAIPSNAGLPVPAQGHLEIRFRQGGEQMVWHGQTKSLKKLLQQWRVPPWLRGQVPLLFLDEQLVAVVGYAMSDTHDQEGGGLTYQFSFLPER